MTPRPKVKCDNCGHQRFKHAARYIKGKLVYTHCVAQDCDCKHFEEPEESSAS